MLSDDPEPNEEFVESETNRGADIFKVQRVRKLDVKE